MADVKQDMLPDSTQGETPDQKKGTKRKGSKDGKKKKKVAKRKSKITGKRKTKSSPGSDVDSDLDLSKEKQPLEFYLHDREELINEAFIAVTGLQLTNMVPDILKYVPLDELKRLCLNQLEGLSRKRIRHIIQGTEMLSSSDSDESAPEDEVGAVTMTTTSVQADVTVNMEEEKKDGAEMETCVDSTVVPVTNPHPDSQKAGVESKAEDIDGVPVEVDVNIEELAFGKAGAQPGSRAVKTSSGDGGTAAKPSKDTSKTKSKGSTEKHSHVSSTHQRSTSRSPRRRRRSWSSRSRSRGRYSRSRSRSRRRSWSRSRSRSRSWSRSWSRSRSRSRTRSRSPGRKEALPADPPLPPSPPPPPPHVDAIQMRYPTPPTPSGSLSSGEIREILELESEEDEEEEEEALEERRCREQEMRRKLEGLIGGRKGLEHKVPGKMTCVSVTGKLEDDAAPPGVDDADDMVVQCQSGPAESISSVSQSCEDVAAGNEEAETRGKGGTYPGKMSCEEDDDDEEDDSDDDSDDSDDSDDDSEEDDDDDDDINLDSLDLGVDMSKAAGQPSQLALARASIKSPLTSNAAEEQKDSGEAELEVLELELRARAIRSLMHKCLKEDDKT